MTASYFLAVYILKKRTEETSVKIKCGSTTKKNKLRENRKNENGNGRLRAYY
jgi:hypothetical protein